MGGTTIMRRLLSRDAARTVLASDRRHRAHAALVFDRDHADQVVFESMDWSQPGRKGYFDRNRALISQSVPLEDALVEDPMQVLFSGPARHMRGLYESVRGVDPPWRDPDRVRAPQLFADRHHRSRRHQGPRPCLARLSSSASTPTR